MRLSEHAYAQIKEMIKTRMYRPGDPLPEAELCQILQMSRTPVRQALQKLQEEQIVKIRARHGAFVATLDFKELCNIYESREAIEGMMVNLNCRPHIPVRPYIELRNAIQKLSSEPNSPTKFLELNNLSIKLIELIKKNSENPILEKMSDMITEQINTLAEVTRTIPKFPDESAPEHIQILDAIIAKNSAQAETFTRSHVRNVFTRILKSMQS